MGEVEFDDYLGDVIANDGKNKKNLQKRLSRGTGVITQIMSILELVSFGQHYVDIALLLRESMFLSSILNNIEVWYAIKKSEIEALEALDRILLRKIMQAPATTPKESFYLEMGLIPIGILLKMRRIMYLHYLLNRPRSEMLAQFFWAQWNDPFKGDWTTSVRQDLVELDLPTDPDLIAQFSKHSFGQLVKAKSRDYAFKNLLDSKAKHSKLRFLAYSKFERQNYLNLPGVFISEVRSVFLFRVHMQHFSENFRSSAKESRLCPLCSKHSDSQETMAKCEFLKSKFKGSMQLELDNIYSERVNIDSVKSVNEVLTLRDKAINELK